MVERMPNQLQYEDVEMGADIPSLTKNPTTRQLVQWAGASADFYEIHYDQDFARNNNGLPDVIVHGRLKAAFLTNMITDWIGELGVVRKLNVRYKEVDPARLPIVCRGRVATKYQQDGESMVECEVWTENQNGQQTTTGSFVVSLPSRAS
jgi:acyl dehydratase